MTTRSFNNNLELCIEALSFLPIEDFLPITLESEGEKAVWTSMRNYFQGKAAWLRVLMLMEAPPPSLLNKGLFLLPYAEMSKALADLITAVYVRAEDSSLVMTFESPSELWLACEVSTCLIQLDNGGLTGSPALMGKKDILACSGKVLDWFATVADGINTKLPPDVFLPSSRNSLAKEVEAVALVLARIDSEFNQRHYRPYLKAVKRNSSQIKRCKDIQFCYYLPQNDQLFVTGKNKKLPPRT
jgi:hypothetical protein